MADDFFSQLKDILRSGEVASVLVNPADPSQSVMFEIAPLPERPAWWPKSMPEPLML